MARGLPGALPHHVTQRIECWADKFWPAYIPPPVVTKKAGIAEVLAGDQQRLNKWNIGPLVTTPDGKIAFLTAPFGIKEALGNQGEKEIRTTNSVLKLPDDPSALVLRRTPVENLMT